MYLDGANGAAPCCLRSHPLCAFSTAATKVTATRWQKKKAISILKQQKNKAKEAADKADDTNAPNARELMVKHQNLKKELKLKEEEYKKGGGSGGGEEKGDGDGGGGGGGVFHCDQCKSELSNSVRRWHCEKKSLLNVSPACCKIIYFFFFPPNFSYFFFLFEHTFLNTPF